MFRVTLLALLFLKTAAIAQPNLLDNYSIFDSCPDPVRYHIASRAIFVLDSDRTTKETQTEYFDRAGRLVKLSDEYRGSDTSRPPEHMMHYYSYNERGYISADSGVYDSTPYAKSMHFFIAYEYLPDRIIERFDHFGDSSVTVSYFDNQNNLTRKYIINGEGDTVFSAVTRGDTTLTLYYSRSKDGSLIRGDSSITITTPTKVSLCAYLNYRIDDIYREQQLYNKRGQLLEEKTWLNDSILRDSSHYTYTKRGRLIHSTSTILPLRELPYDTTTTTWYSDYTYARHGRLVRLIEWSDKHPDQLYFILYTYNEKGLPTGMRETRIDENGREVRRREEIWSYKYY